MAVSCKGWDQAGGRSNKLEGFPDVINTHRKHGSHWCLHWAGGEDGWLCGAWAVILARGTMSAAGFEAAHARAARLYSRHPGR